jgi:UDP-N-acetylglucosamine acyltransferase
VIGDGTEIGSHCVIEGKTTIGKNNKIFSHAALGTIPQDLKFAGEDVELIIGDNNTIREFTLFNPGTKGGGGKTVIGSNNLFMGYTHVAHDCIIGDHCIFANVATLAGHVECDDYVVVGGLTPIHQFCKIGTQVMIAGGSVVTQDIPPFCLAEGNRANVRGLNLTGLRRRFENRSDIDAIKKAYKAIFESGRPISESAQELLDKSENEHVKQLADFVLNTKRGIPFNRK